MKTVSVRDFTRQFPSLRREPLQVTDRNQVIGTWTPLPKKPKPVDIMARLREDGFSKPLPFTGAELLKAGKKR